MIEALIELLRRTGVIEALEIDGLFIAAWREAARLPPGYVDPHEVRVLIDALAARARGRASRDGESPAPESSAGREPARP